MAFVYVLTLNACGSHETETYGFRDAGQVRRIEKDTSVAGLLREAVQSGELAKVEEFLNGGADVNQVWDDGRTPLIEAVVANQTEIVELLLFKGADPAIADRDGWTAIDHAKDRPSILSLLQPPSGKDQAELFAAVRENRFEDLREMLRSGADPNATDGDGETLLTLAVGLGLDSIVRTLLQDPRTDVNAANRKGQSPLRIAREAGFRRAEQMLLQKGARADGA